MRRHEHTHPGSHLALQQNPAIFDQVPDTAAWLASDAFAEVTTSDAANTRAKLQGRIEFVRAALLDAAE